MTKEVIREGVMLMALNIVDFVCYLLINLFLFILIYVCMCVCIDV